MNDEKNRLLEYLAGRRQRLETSNADRNARLEILRYSEEEYENERKEDREEQAALEFLFRVWRHATDGKEGE